MAEYEGSEGNNGVFYDLWRKITEVEVDNNLVSDDKKEELTEDEFIKRSIDKAMFIHNSYNTLKDEMIHNEVIDLYNNIEEGKKSIAYKLTFKDPSRTLTDEEVMEVFNKIITEVTTKCNVKLRDN